MNLAYYIFLLLIIFLLFLLLIKGNKLLPQKIKGYMTVVIIFFLVRYMGLFLCCIVKSVGVIYYLKPILFMNNLTVPLMVIALTYVFLRPEKVDFYVTYILGGLLIGLYALVNIFMDGTVRLNPNYGYIVTLDKEVIFGLGILIILAFLLAFLVISYDKKNINKKGILFLIMGISIVMVENIVIIGGVKFFPFPIIGDALFILIINLAFDTFKKRIGEKYT